jgi:hypothetical protein
MTKQELIDAWRNTERRRQDADDFVATYASDNRASDIYSYDDYLNTRRFEVHLSRILARIQSMIELRWGVCIDSIMYTPERDWTQKEQAFMSDIILS